MPAPRPNIAELHAYTPGEQPAPGTRVVKLNTNENPYPPSPEVLKAIANVSAEALRRYPMPDAAVFRQTAAQLHGLTPEHVIATNGGDELLRLLITVFCTPGSTTTADRKAGLASGGGGIGVMEPTYSLYPVLARIHDTPITSVDRELPDFAFPNPTIVANTWNEAGCALAFVVNPHAPSGTLIDTDTLLQLARSFMGVLVVDEAYVDFAPQSALALLKQHDCDNVVLLRSLSKGYGLAGLRFGYGLAHPDLVNAMHKARDSYNCDVIAQAAAVAALKDQVYARTTWQQVVDQRDRLTTTLRQADWHVIPSHSNFLLVTPPAQGSPSHAPSAETLYKGLKDNGLLVRWFNTPLLADKLRITIGTSEQVDHLLNALATLTAAKTTTPNS